MKKSPLTLSPAGVDPAYRLLMEKRCEVYTRTAGLVMEVEESLDAEDHERARWLVEDLRKALRSALAFLTDEVYEELERVEGLAVLLAPERGAGVPQAPGFADSGLAELRDCLQLLHVKLAHSLRLPGQDVVEIVGLPSRLKRKLDEGRKALAAKQRRRAVEERSWDYEAVARELIGARQYKKAVKELRRAIRLDPERAVFHNDLGVVLGLLGLHDEAAQCYRQAVALNERLPDRRTDEWATSYYNLGTALRRLAHEHDEAGADTLHVPQGKRALALVREARAAFDEYLKVTPTGPKVGFARQVARQLGEDALILETRLREAAAQEASGQAAAAELWPLGSSSDE